MRGENNMEEEMTGQKDDSKIKGGKTQTKAEQA